MTSRIRSISVAPIRLTPTEAELAIEVHCSELHPTTELHGRLMGPTCLYSTTVEVAYPIRMHSRGRGQPVLHGRVIIPEPAWWDVESPFLYHGPIELWEHESRVESSSLRCGLRHAVWTSEQLNWNGRPVVLKSQALTEVDETTLRSLRGRGFNAVIVAGGIAKTVWPIADRIGLFVITDPPIAVDGLQHPCAVPLRNI
jgi:beta-galactosidase/beta-glucuronidase